VSADSPEEFLIWAALPGLLLWCLILQQRSRRVRPVNDWML